MATKIIGIFFILFGVFAVVNLDFYSHLNFYINLAKLTETPRWFWATTWFISWFIFCGTPILAGLIMLKKERKMKKVYFAIFFSALYVGFLIGVITNYIILNSWQLIVVMGLGILGTSYWGTLFSQIGEMEE